MICCVGAVEAPNVQYSTPQHSLQEPLHVVNKTLWGICLTPNPALPDPIVALLAP